MSTPVAAFKYTGLQLDHPIAPVAAHLRTLFSGVLLMPRNLFGDRGKSNIFVQYPQGVEPTGAAAFLRKHYRLKREKTVAWSDKGGRRRGENTLHVSVICKRKLCTDEWMPLAQHLCDKLCQGGWGNTFTCIVTGRNGLDISGHFTAALLCTNDAPFFDAYTMVLQDGTRVGLHSLQTGQKKRSYGGFRVDSSAVPVQLQSSLPAILNPPPVAVAAVTGMPPVQQFSVPVPSQQNPPEATWQHNPYPDA
ncbi:hypothetical protein DIPPA_26801 [Diplonema papillatum]|nr:hypothetical protein DIPPA_26801 [Diplonema papillatum]